MGNTTAIVSGYVRYRPKGKSYLLMLNSRRLVSFVEKRIIRATVSRKDNLFILNINSQGNLLRTHIKEVLTPFAGKTILNEK